MQIVYLLSIINVICLLNFAQSICDYFLCYDFSFGFNSIVLLIYTHRGHNYPVPKKFYLSDCFKPSILQPIIFQCSFIIAFAFQLLDLLFDLSCNFFNDFHLAAMSAFVFNFGSLKFDIQKFHYSVIEPRYPLISTASLCSHYTFIIGDYCFSASLSAVSANLMIIDWRISFKYQAIFNCSFEISTGHYFNIFHLFKAGFNFIYTC